MKKIIAAAIAAAFVAPAFAEVTVSGDVEYFFVNGNSGKTYSDSGDQDVTVAGSEELGNGMTVTASLEIDGSDSDIASDSSLTISGDFGSFRYTAAGDDHALSAIDIDGGATAEEAFSRTAAQGASTLHEVGGIGNETVTYVLPSIVDGLYVAGSLANGTGANGEAAAYGIKYDAGMFAVTYGQLKGQVVTTTHVGVSASMGDFGLALAKNSDDTANEDRSATLMGLTYAMGDITLGYESEQMENGTATSDEKHTAFGASYAIAPGLSASLTMAESDKMQGQTDVATTSIGIHVSF